MLLNTTEVHVGENKYGPYLINITKKMLLKTKTV